MSKLGKKENYDELTAGHDEIIRSIVDDYVTHKYIVNEEDSLNIQKIIMKEGYYEAFLVLEENGIVKYN